MKSVTLIALLAGATVTAHANEPVGVLKNVSGTISVSGQKFMTRASEGTPVANGSSVLVASNGKATLVLNNGCTIPLAASQHVVVDAKLPCQQIQASVKQLFPAYQVAQANVSAGVPGAGTGAGTTGAAAGATGAGAGATAGAAAGATGAGAAAGAAAAGGALSGLGATLAGLGVGGAIGAGVLVAAVVNEATKNNDPVSPQ